MTTKLLGRVDPSRLLSLAVTAALVGLLAGLAGGLFASVAGEPPIDAAIALEEQAAAPAAADAGHDVEESAVVSRSVQRGVGLYGAYALTGAAFGALLALLAFLLRRDGSDASRRVLLAGVTLAGAFTVAPWFKYPPNPPAVGVPSTLAERQGLYSVLILVAVVVGIGAIALGRRLRAASWSGHARLAAVAAAVVAPMLTTYALLPPAPDAVEVSATLVWRFRVASLGANLTLWTVLTLALCWVVAEASRRREMRDAADLLAASSG